MEETYKRGPMGKHVFFIFIVITGLMLAYAFTMPDRSATAGYFPFFHHNRDKEQAATEQAILKWMKENSEMPDHVLAKIYKAAANTGNRDLVLAICLVESNFNPHVESHKGAIGLMGIMPDIWLEELKAEGIIKEKEDLYNISGNIAAGAYEKRLSVMWEELPGMQPGSYGRRTRSRLQEIQNKAVLFSRPGPKDCIQMCLASSRQGNQKVFPQTQYTETLTDKYESCPETGLNLLQILTYFFSE
jgi:hypothetical protein